MTATGIASRVKWILSIALCSLAVQSIFAAEDKDKPAAETDANRLAQYYGSSPMEILKLQWKLGEPIIADINADGLNDLVFINNRQAKIDLLLQKKEELPDPSNREETSRDMLINFLVWVQWDRESRPGASFRRRAT